MNQKYIYNSNKAYLQIDFALAIFIFLLVVSTFLFTYSSFEKSNSSKIENLKLQSLSNDLCYILTSTQGLPINWEENSQEPQFFGLLNLSNSQLSEEKINYFFNQSNFFEIQQIINTDFYFTLTLKNLTNNQIILKLGITPNFSNYIQSSTCYSMYKNNKVSLLIEVWQ